MSSHTSHVRLALAAAICGLLLSTAAAAETTPPSPGQPTTAHEDHAGMHGDHAGKRGMHHQMTGDQDYDFATMMRHHHEMGVRMAQQQLTKGKDPTLRKMAQKIVDEQQKEIAQLDGWLAKNKPQAGAAKAQ